MNKIEEMLLKVAGGDYWTEQIISSSQLNIPEEYQREYSEARVKQMAKVFNPYKVSMVKVVRRADGKYYVIDGQHTMHLLIHMNGGNPVPVRCQVTTNFTPEQEAEFFAKQHDGVKSISAASRFKAEVFANDEIAVDLNRATEAAGLKISTNGKRTDDTICCVSKAKTCLAKYGAANYSDALRIIKAIWGGDAKSLSGEIISGMCCFVSKYAKEYDRDRVVHVMVCQDPAIFVAQAKSTYQTIAGDARYCQKIVELYNYRSKKPLPSK